MSTTLSTPPETGLGVFRDITPGGIPRNRENSTWAVASLGGTLYLAVVSHDVQTVQRYQAGKWETAYQKIIRRAKNEEPGELPAMQLVTGESSHGPAIYLKITDGATTEYLRSSEDGSTLESVPEHFDDVEKAFSEANSLPAELPDHPASARYAHSFTLGGKTAVALNDPVLGCSAWVKGETWQPAFTRGAHRFSDNAEVFAAAAWDNAVVFALGKSGPAPLGKTLPGFELVRVYADGSWDLLIGTPRVSNQGLKVPLSCIAPGMNDFSPTQFCFLSAGKSHLLLGTYDDLAGFRIWRSADGINWSAGEAELVGIDRVRAAQAKRIAGGTAIAFDIDSPQDKHTRAIWIGE
jgi:hypothetical protein